MRFEVVVIWGVLGYPWGCPESSCDSDTIPVGFHSLIQAWVGERGEWRLMAVRLTTMIVGGTWIVGCRQLSIHASALSCRNAGIAVHVEARDHL